MISQFQLQKHEGVNGIIKTKSKRNQEKGKREAEKSEDKYKAKNEGVEIIQNISVVTVNINEQSYAIKRQRLKWGKIQVSTVHKKHG